MPPEIVPTDNPNALRSNLDRAADVLRDGGLVIFPTETVYGVAANALVPRAVQQLREIKGREDAKPFTVHIPNRAAASHYVPNPPPIARRLSRKVWPGPLTLVCTVDDPAATPVGQRCDDTQRAAIYDQHRVALRCPDHHVAADLLRTADVPVVATSAHAGGAKPAHDVATAIQSFPGQAALAIDGGPTRYRGGSTVVAVRDEGYTIERPGVLDERMIDRFARSAVIFICTGNSCRSPLAEYIFRQKLAEKLGITVADLERSGYAVSSAGTAAFNGGPISEGSRIELERRGIDARAHAAQPVTIELLQGAERLYVMSPDHQAAVLGVLPAARSRLELLDPDGPVSDPIGGGPEDYERCGRQIERAIEQRLEEFLDEDRNW